MVLAKVNRGFRCAVMRDEDVDHEGDVVARSASMSVWCSRGAAPAIKAKAHSEKGSQRQAVSIWWRDMTGAAFPYLGPVWKLAGSLVPNFVRHRNGAMIREGGSHSDHWLRPSGTLQNVLVHDLHVKLIGWCVDVDQRTTSLNDVLSAVGVDLAVQVGITINGQQMPFAARSAPLDTLTSLNRTPRPDRAPTPGWRLDIIIGLQRPMAQLLAPIVE